MATTANTTTRTVEMVLVLQATTKHNIREALSDHLVDRDRFEETSEDVFPVKTSVELLEQDAVGDAVKYEAYRKAMNQIEADLLEETDIDFAGVVPEYADVSGEHSGGDT